jgi:hypothetical protein
MRTLMTLTAGLGFLAAVGAFHVMAEQTQVTTRPGPFRGYTQTEIRRNGDPKVTRCTTRPGPFKGQTTTDCQ